MKVTASPMPASDEITDTRIMHCFEQVDMTPSNYSMSLLIDLYSNLNRENFSTLLQHIQKLQDLSVVKHNIVTETLLECTRASALFKLLEQVIHVAGTSAELHAKMIASSPDCKNEMEADCLPPPPVNWSHVMGFLPLVVFALTKWKTEVVGLREAHLNAVLVSCVFNTSLMLQVYVN